MRIPRSPSMKVIWLRQAAVFMNAGSEVIRPPSSGAVLIWRRSVARIAPSEMGISYCFPVRLSVTVSVSAITTSGVRVWVSIGVRVGYRVAGHPVASIHPSGQVLVPAPFAAERAPARVHGTRPALDAQRDLAHPAYFSPARSDAPSTTARPNGRTYGDRVFRPGTATGPHLRMRPTHDRCVCVR